MMWSMSLLSWVVQSPLVHVVAETAEISQLLLGEKIAAIPKVWTVMRDVVQNTEF